MPDYDTRIHPGTSDQFKQFVCVPLKILQLNLSPGALKALIGLLSYRNQETGQCNPRIEKLCGRLGEPRRTVCRWLLELRQAGILEITNNPGGVNFYAFHESAFRGHAKNGTGGHAKNGTEGGAAPLVYEQIKGNKSTRAETRARAFPSKKSIQSETLARYYAQYGGKNGTDE